MNSRHAQPKNLFPLLLLAGCIIALNFFGIFSQKFFRDFGIVFEGGYRIYRGQVPFRDFFLPLGPVCLYLQAFFNLLAGPSLAASALHAGVLAAILSCLFYEIIVEKLGQGLSFFMGIALFFSYTGLINYPWYNETAFFFFILNILLILRQIGKPALSPAFLALSSLLAVLGIFSKQDVGLLHFILIGAYFARFQGLKRATLYYALPGLGILLLLVLLFQSQGDFLYWFNYGQRHIAKHEKSFSDLKNVFFNWRFLALIAAGAFYFKVKPEKEAQKLFFLLALLLLVPFITFFSSGVPEQTQVQAIPILLYLAGEILNKRFPDLQLRFQKYLRISYVLIATLSLNLLPLTAQYILGNFFVGNDAAQPPLIQKALRHFGYSGHTKIKTGAYRNCVIHRGYLFYLDGIREVLQKAKGDFFNMSEYTFLYTDFNVDPPRGFPLWFHHGTSYFDNEFLLLKEPLLARAPQVILLQDVHTNQRRQIKFELYYFYAQRGYRKLLTAQAPAVRRIEVLVR